ncbi:hypothetical protein FW774_17050 [Pedobacter sp. BS3]|uniref:hypothetical protein n=1 Tax=Pedobacter sp. BS3 TaxID=2567937 RepID=UPI0011EDEED8|nr:hypothetical protein [Pedobacter sp. BS3]TZF81764.1 hypothetical protein FW774_17050 [Pedobacter sp. BS3]
MNNKHFIPKRDLWLEEVNSQCHEYAKEIDLDFYVFQTPINKYNPDLLIIGINPGGEGKYSKWLERNKKDKRTNESLYYGVNTLVEKPYWEIEDKNKGADTMRAAFSKVFTEENGLKSVLKNAVMMNMIYFNTKTEKDLNSIPIEMRNFCISKTLEFIDILKPKNILFLTNEKMLKKYGVKNILQVSDTVKKGNLNDLDIFCIPHYGAYAYYSDKRGRKMGDTLAQLFNK